MTATTGYARVDPREERPPRNHREAAERLRAMAFPTAYAKLLQVIEWAATEWERVPRPAGVPADLFRSLHEALRTRAFERTLPIYDAMLDVERAVRHQARQDFPAFQQLALSRIARYLMHGMAELQRMEQAGPFGPALDQLWADVSAGLQAAEALGGTVFLTRWWYDPVPES